MKSEDATTPLLLAAGLDGAPPESAEVKITPREATKAFSLDIERRFSRDEEGFHTLSPFGKTEDASWTLLGGAALRYSTTR